MNARTRGFMFLALGAVTALMAGANKLKIYENGMGAINLPYSGNQLGVDNTRAVHPYSLFLMSEFIGILIDEPFQFENPFLFSTKAEMCDMFRAEGLEYLVAQSTTCGHPRRKKDKGIFECGICTSCLLRRQAMFAAGFADTDTSNYDFDVTHAKMTVHQDRLSELLAMLNQVNVFRRCLQSRETWKELCHNFPNLEFIPDTIAQQSEMEKSLVEQFLIRMFQRYIDEWSAFPLNREIRRAFMMKGITR